jgi:hypothetical protein
MTQITVSGKAYFIFLFWITKNKQIGTTVQSAGER